MYLDITFVLFESLAMFIFFTVVVKSFVKLDLVVNCAQYIYV